MRCKRVFFVVCGFLPKMRRMKLLIMYENTRYHNAFGLSECSGYYLRKLMLGQPRA